MADLTIKSFSGVEIKDAEKGEVEAVFATIGVKDHDDDVVRPNAIQHGAKVVVSAYGHDAVFGKRPAGKGVVFIDGNKAGVRAKMFMNTTDGRETFEVLKAMGPDQEWSFGFQVLDWEPPNEAEKKAGARRALTKLDSFEVSPVIRGAGIGTHTVAVKSAPEPQADGVSEDVEDDDELVAEVLAAVAARRLEAKRLRDEEAAQKEAARVAAETKAAEDAEAARMAPLIALRDRYLRIVDEHAPSPQREFERFQKTMARHK